MIRFSARRRLIRWTSVIVCLMALAVGVGLWRSQPAEKAITKQVSNSMPSQSAAQPKAFDKSQYSVNDPLSLWVVVNKGRILPSDYSPKLEVPNVPLNYDSSANDSHLRPEAAMALEQMFAKAESLGYKLKLFSGYRSYGEQTSVYNNFVAKQGQTQADTFSARPGHSEHQTGLAADVSTVGGRCELAACYGSTDEGKWLAANAYSYGFIVRYQEGKQNLTGYIYEPWHMRYVGKELAAEIHKTDQTLEQYFNLATYPDYPATSYELKSGN